MEGWITEIVLQDDWHELATSQFATVQMLVQDSLGI
jgi:hypothetical protein